MVYDLDNKRVGISNAVWNATDTDIQGIVQSSALAASASTAATVTITQTATASVTATTVGGSAPLASTPSSVDHASFSGIPTFIGGRPRPNHIGAAATSAGKSGTAAASGTASSSKSAGAAPKSLPGAFVSIGIGTWVALVVFGGTVVIAAAL